MEINSQVEDVDRLNVRDEMRIRILTIADHAALAEGKLYISGSGVGTVFMPQMPGAIMAPLFLVIRVYVPYAETSEPHSLTIRFLTEDRQPVGPPETDPMIRLENLEVGRRPGTRPGDESSFDFAVGLMGFPVQVETETRTYFHVDVDNGRVIDSIALKLVQVQPMAIQRAP
jgi:hypothetical protein